MTLPVYAQYLRWGQIALAVAEKIQSGQWTPGHVLPAVSELTELFGAGKHTVRPAQDELKRLGLAERRGHNLYVVKQSGGSQRA